MKYLISILGIFGFSLLSYGASIEKITGNAYDTYRIVMDTKDDAVSVNEFDYSFSINNIEDTRCLPNACCLWAGEIIVSGWVNDTKIILRYQSNESVGSVLFSDHYQMQIGRVVGGFSHAPYVLDIDISKVN